MPKGFFITGTDTGVGKTVVTAALIKACGLIGLKACGMKPIETGCKKTRGIRTGDTSTSLMPSDGAFLREMSGANDSLDLITPVRFENPLAPLPASKIEKKRTSMQKIKKSFARLAAKNEAVIVEGIGGLLVPIRKDYFVVDLAKEIGLPLIVVSRPGLGTINHTLLTVNYALREGLVVAGVIINHSSKPEKNLAESTNLEVIRQVCEVPVIGVFPHLRDLGSVTIQKATAKNLDFKVIREYLS